MIKRIFLRGCQINGAPFVQSDEETVKKVQRLEKRRKCRVKNAECRVDSLSVSPLPKPKFAKGSHTEIPRLTLCLRDNSLPLGMTT